MTPVMLRGAAPKTAVAVSPGNASSSPRRNQSTNPWMPAWRIWPTHDRLSAESSANHGMSVSIRDIAAELRAPVDRRSASAARSRELPSPGVAGTARTLTGRP